MNKWFRKIMGLMLCLVMVLSISGCSGRLSALKIGTGGEKGTYHSYVKELSGLVGQDNPIEALPSAGSVSSIKLLRYGFLEGAVVQNDILYSAITGDESLEVNNVGDNLGFCAVAGLYTEALQIITGEASKINSISDLRGKKVNIGEEESGVIINAKQVLLAYGMTAEDITPFNLSYDAAAEALKNGTIDAFFCMSGIPSAIIEELSDTMKLKFIPIGSAEADSLLGLYPFFEKTSIPAGTYHGQNEDITTVGVRAVLVMSNKVSAKRVKGITKALFTEDGSPAGRIRQSADLTPQKAVDNILVPFHKGAASFYKDHGITVDEEPQSNNDLGY